MIGLGAPRAAEITSAAQRLGRRENGTWLAECGSLAARATPGSPAPWTTSRRP